MLPVFLINLDRSPERLAFMQEQAAALGFSFTRVSGVDGRARLPDALKDKFPDDRMTPGEVGCYASHLCVYRSMLEASISAALVLEDDATVDHNIMDVAQRAVLAADDGWDVIHLSCQREGRPVALLGASQLIRYARPPMGTVGYLISASGARKMLAIKQRVRPVDMEFRFGCLHGLNIFGVAPAPVREVAFATTIDDRPQKRSRGYWAPSLASSIWRKIAALCLNFFKYQRHSRRAPINSIAASRS